MFDEQEQPAETLDSDAAETTAAEDKTEVAGQHDDDHDEADSQEQPAEEEEEIEVGDRKLALPKSVAAQLKTERMLNADYTQKTQAVAAERQQVAAERAEVQRQAKDHQQYIGEIAKVHSIDERLAQYNAAITSQLSIDDPALCQRYMVERDALYAERHQAVTSLTQKEQQIALNKQQEIAKQVQQADAYMKREIPGFNPERSNQLQQYALKQGMTADAITKAIVKNPVVAVLMHKAELYDKLLAKQAPKTPPVAAAKPAIRVGSNATVKKEPTSMTDAEFAAYRRSISSRK